MKIFGIGLSRTGTTSLTKALSILGYSSYHFPESDEIIDQYEALTDTSVALRYKELDKKYPGSKFILTTRNREAWLRSCENFWAAAEFDEFCNYINMEVYGTYKYEKTVFDLRRKIHTLDVLDYFNDRLEDLLILDICHRSPNINPWRRLCKFLNKPVPKEPFPHENQLCSQV